MLLTLHVPINFPMSQCPPACHCLCHHWTLCFTLSSICCAMCIHLTVTLWKAVLCKGSIEYVLCWSDRAYCGLWWWVNGHSNTYPNVHKSMVTDVYVWGHASNVWGQCVRTMFEDNVCGQCMRAMYKGNVWGQCMRTMCESNVWGQWSRLCMRACGKCMMGHFENDDTIHLHS